MSTARLKFIAFILSAVCIWQLAQVPSVQKALLDFVAVGVIPGTNAALSPAATWLAIIGLSAFVMLFPIGRVVRRTFRRYRARRLMGVAAVKSLRVRTATVPVQPAAELLGWWGKQAGSIVIPKQPAKESVSWRTVADGFLSRALVLSQTWGHIFGSAAVRLYGMLRGVVAQLSVWAIAAWRWAEPFIRMFDHWLDVKLHQNDFTAILLAMLSDGWKAVGNVYRWFRTLGDRSRQYARKA